MAKKQKKQGTQQKSTSGIETNLPNKGMIKDTDSSYLDKKNWSHARNAINNSVDGDVGVIGNEPANILCADIPYTVIGGIHLYGDKWIIFSTDNINTNPADGLPVNDKSSEIGEFDDSTCTYTPLINDTCLNFHQDYLVIGVAKENFDCTWQIYWDDGNNPSRTINLGDIPYVKYVTSAVGASCTTYANVIPLQLDCEQIRLAPLLDTPVIELTKASDGGSLANGSYQVFIAYAINDQVIGDYLGYSNIQPIWDHDNNKGSLDIKFAGLDKDFEWFQLVIRARIHNGHTNNVMGYYSTETTSVNVDYIDPSSPQIKNSILLHRKPAYEKSSGMWAINDYLIRTSPTEQFDFNYQPLANQIVTEWTSHSYPSNYYTNGGNKPTLLRDEVYTFFIRFVYNTGEKSNSYHIPGRAPDAGDILIDTSVNTYNGTDRVFKTTNTASLGATVGSPQADGGIFEAYGNMGYWESTEKYPSTDPVRWDTLCGENIRHHKVPFEGTHGTTQLSTPDGDSIYIIGAQFSNIASPRDNNGALITNIVGYEILVGSRDGNKSIIAKGIIRNMMAYERSAHSRSINDTDAIGSSTSFFNPLDETYGPITAWEDDIQNVASTGGINSGTTFSTPVGESDIEWGLIPNYPYNDMGIDPYLVYRGNGDIDPTTSPWFKGLFGGVPVESNWLTGKGGLLQNSEESAHMTMDDIGLNEFTRDTHTFHSPDLNFTKQYLNANTLQVYGTLTGTAEGYFKKSEGHPGQKLLKNKAVLIAAIIGVGYALNQMRGKRNVKINTARSQSTGEAKAVASGVAPMPGPGTAAGAVNILLNLPGVIVGAAADMAFNTLVDVASVFGAGKLARQIGTPIYQMIETGTSALMAGHIGPNKTIEYVGSDFTSVPSLFSMVTGILTFLNYVAVGGDKIIDLILNLVSYQDYAYKYISHGFYGQYNIFPGVKHRFELDRARYIGQGMQYFDGNIKVNNLHRPSTVVVRNQGTCSDTSFTDHSACIKAGNTWTPNNILSPIDHWYSTCSCVGAVGNQASICAAAGGVWTCTDDHFYDDSKFVIAGAQCVGTGNNTCSWWTPGGRVQSKIAANYVGLKVENDAQYGQIDSIMFTPIKYYRYEDELAGADLALGTRFTTGPLFPGDSYVSRYTEKVTMPFWYSFLKEGPDGIAFDYRNHSNVPFPRYWMNTEKYRMDEFVRPITNLSFDFSQAYPSDLYHLDLPTDINCAANTYVPGGDDAGNKVSNYEEGCNHHLEVVSVPTSTIMMSVYNFNKSKEWAMSGVCKTQWLNHGAITSAWYTQPATANPQIADPGANYEIARKREVAAGIEARHNDHGHPTPLIDWDGSSCISSGSDDWMDLANPRGDDNTAPQTFDMEGRIYNLKALYNWNLGQFVCPVAIGTQLGQIAAPGYAGPGGPCRQNSRCFTTSCTNNGNASWVGNGTDVTEEGINTGEKGFDNKLDCEEAGYSWCSCIPEDDPTDVKARSYFYTVNESGWASFVDLDDSSFGVNTNLDCDGSASAWAMPGTTSSSSKHYLKVKGGKPPKAKDAKSGTDSYDPQDADGQRKTDGLFVMKTGYIYTHNSGVNDFFVESDMNLTFRDYEDVVRKRHYDEDSFTDLVEMFHANEQQHDNYYKYDKSVGFRRFWNASFGMLQPRWYDPIVSETCFTNYPKRLLYSLPATGVDTKALKTHKNEKRQDFWRVYLPENFRDFKSKVNTIVPTDKTGALILFPFQSPQKFQGQDVLKVGGNKLTLGDGGLFSQAFQNITNSNISHEFGSCESARSVVNTPAGVFYISQAQGKIFQYSGKGLNAISDNGMKWWFNKYLPSQLLKAFPDMEKYISRIDNPVVSAGCQTIYDPMNDLVYFCKRDYKPREDKVANLSFGGQAGNRLQYNDGWQVFEVDVNDPVYFEDISWTVSYDPKSKAWISFHDWHPELSFNSINHFLTTKKGVSATPICPDGYTYNGTTQLCEISAVGSTPATVVNNTVAVTETITPCEFDAVMCVDASNSIAGNGNVDNVRAFCQGILNGFTNSLAAAESRIGMVRFGGGEQNGAGSCDAYDDDQMVDLTSNLTTLSDWTYNTGSFSPASSGTTAGLGFHVGTGSSTYWGDPGFVGDLPCGTDIIGGIWHALAILYGPTSRAGVDKKLFIVIDGAHSNCGTQVSTYDAATDLPFSWTSGQLSVVTPTLTLQTVTGNGFGWSLGGPDVTWFVTNILNSGNYPDLEVHAVSLDGNGTQAQELAYMGQFDPTSGNSNTHWGTFSDPNAAQIIADNIINTACVPPVYTCPAGYVINGTCPTCDCVESYCSCASTPGYGTTSNWETGICNDLIDPLICNYDFSDSVSPNYITGGLWRHNARTDKFANFYGTDYPWEIDLIETSGQNVSTVRSIEYQLEAYTYKNDGRDRFHVLDFNFDEAEIYNSEQTSGLLKLNISPKNNAPLITGYPIVNANDIDILYSKEEQKYRFNQFWDVTTDRGEFSAVENTIYLTRLNGYIRDLNMANINLNKPVFERKKFRHYFNHVVLRRSVSNDKKMLLRLTNAKINTSMR